MPEVATTRSPSHNPSERSSSATGDGSSRYGPASSSPKAALMAPRQARHSSGRAGRSWDSRSAIRSVYRSGPTVRQQVPVPQDGGVLGEIEEVSSALRRATRRRSAAAVLAVVLLTVGCTSFAEPRGVSAPREPEERPV